MDEITQLLSPFLSQRGTLLAALQAIQNQYGFISDAAVVAVAAAYQIDQAEVRGVITFYTDLRTTPPGKHRLRVCRGDSCAAVGAADIADAVERHLHVAPSETTPDGRFTYETIYCMGNCALSPSLSIDDELHARVTPRDIEPLRRLLAEHPEGSEGSEGSEGEA
ncbi:MAG TPA: NAD(P)H-dependent oxidoreductase subunit E [Tepidisphaeraceae bacterium]|jgi:formate dehydrogenase subunit gamma